jgi:hypothetical protein
VKSIVGRVPVQQPSTLAHPPKHSGHTNRGTPNGSPNPSCQHHPPAASRSLPHMTRPTMSVEVPLTTLRLRAHHHRPNPAPPLSASASLTKPPPLEPHLLRQGQHPPCNSRPTSRPPSPCTHETASQVAPEPPGHRHPRASTHSSALPRSREPTAHTTQPGTPCVVACSAESMTSNTIRDRVRSGCLAPSRPRPRPRNGSPRLQTQPSMPKHPRRKPLEAPAPGHVDMPQDLYQGRRKRHHLLVPRTKALQSSPARTHGRGRPSPPRKSCPSAPRSSPPPSCRFPRLLCTHPLLPVEVSIP